MTYIASAFGGGSGISPYGAEIEVDFGSIPVNSASFTVTDSYVSATSKVIVTESGNAGTSQGTDDVLWDSVNYAAVPASGSFTLYAKASGYIKGKRKIFYTVI